MSRGKAHLSRFVCPSSIPNVLLDPSGLDKCGPDVTNWFTRDLADEGKDFVRRLDLSHDLFHNKIVDSDAGEAAVNLSTFNDIVKYQLSYKWMNFGGTGTGQCCQTVQLCGMCIRKNQLGNIAFGWLSSYYGDLGSRAAVKYAYAGENGGTYDPNHPHAANWGSSKGKPRTDNLAAFSVGFNFAKPGGDICAALKGDLNRYSNIGPTSGAPLPPNALTLIPTTSGLFDTNTCERSNVVWNGPQSSKDASVALRTEFDKKQGGGDSAFDSWLQLWYEDY